MTVVMANRSVRKHSIQWIVRRRNEEPTEDSVKLRCVRLDVHERGQMHAAMTNGGLHRKNSASTQSAQVCRPVEYVAGLYDPACWRLTDALAY